MPDFQPPTKFRPPESAAVLKPEQLIELLPSAAYVCDAAGRITALNHHAATLWGRTPELNDDADRYCGARQLFAADGTAIARDQCWTARAIRDNVAFHDQEAIVQRCDGELRSVLVHAGPLHDEQGAVVGGLTVVTDVTERIQTEAALRESEDRFRRLSDASFEALMVHERGVVLDANRAFLELTGFAKPEDLIGKSGLDVVPFTAESKAIIRERLSTPRDDVSEVRTTGGDGVERIYETQSRGILYQGREARVVAMRDVTQRRLFEKQLRAGQVHLMASQRIARVGSWELEISGGVDDAKPLRWTDEAYRIFGYSPDEMEASNEAFWARVHPEDRPKIAAAVGRAIQANSVYEVEHRIVLPGGEERIIHERGELELDPVTGEPLKIIGTSRDVTEMRRNEGALRESEARHRMLTEHAHVVLWEGDPTTYQFTYVSEFAEQLLGYPRDDWYQMDFWTAHIHPDDRDAALALCMEYTAARKDHRFEYRMIRRDGKIIWVEDVVHLLIHSDDIKIRGVLIDITERMEAERRLFDAVRSKEEALALLDTLHTEAPVGLAFIDANFRYLRCNTALAEINGLPVELHLGRQVAEVVPSLWPVIEPNCRSVLSGAGPIANCEISGETASSPGELRHWLASYYPVTVGDEILGVGIIVSEISQRKRMEEALRTAEARHRAILDALPDLVFRLDGDGRILDCHASNSAELYSEPSTFLSRKVEEVLPPRTAELIRRHLRCALETRQSQLFEYDLQIPNGDVASYEARMVVSGKNETITVVRNVTQRKRLEEQLRQSQKLEAVGRLAGGIAHDFNNLLTVVNGYSQMLLGRQDVDDIRDALVAIRDAGQRAATLVKQLLAFSRGQRLQPVVLDLNEVLRRIESLIQRMLENKIELKMRLVDSPEFILADRSQMEQVVVNLVVNARDAMPHGGQITLQTRNVELSQSRASALGDLPPGTYVQLSVIDEGEGMAPEVLAHVFEPFFTTKDVGKGTGLGLPVVHGIVKQSGGHIQVASEIGKGTTITILIPAANA